MMVKKFTLVEMLVVFSVLVILFASISPIVGYIEKAKILEAKTEMNRLKVAILDYYNTYKILPITLAPGLTLSAIKAAEGVYLTDAQLENQAGGLSYILSGNNARKIVFYKIKNDSGDTANYILDPWGSPYRIFLDYNYNQEVHTSTVTINEALFSGPVKGRIAIYSLGPIKPGDPTTGTGVKADINSWTK